MRCAHFVLDHRGAAPAAAADSSVCDLLQSRGLFTAAQRLINAPQGCVKKVCTITLVYPQHAAVVPAISCL